MSKSKWEKRRATEEKGYRYRIGEKVFWGMDPYPYEILSYYITDTLEKRYWILRDGKRMSVPERDVHDRGGYVELCEKRIKRSEGNFLRTKARLERYIRIANGEAGNADYMVDASDDIVEDYNDEE